MEHRTYGGVAKSIQMNFFEIYFCLIAVNNTLSRLSLIACIFSCSIGDIVSGKRKAWGKRKILSFDRDKHVFLNITFLVISIFKTHVFSKQT